MSNVIIRHVETELQRMVRTPGGIRISKALQAAEENLEKLRDPMRDAVKAGLADCRAQISSWAERPSDQALKDLHQCADQMIGLCAAAGLEGLSPILMRLCLMTDLLSRMDRWPPRPLDPAIDAAILFAHGALPDSVVGDITDGLDLCIARFSHETDAHHQGPAPPDQPKG